VPRVQQAQQANVVWIHRCNDLVHKIYMANHNDLRTHEVFGLIRPEQLGILYIEDPLLNQLLPRFEMGQTLWAELTPAGRKKIAEAASAPRKAKR
jgi:hypothetical protein